MAVLFMEGFDHYSSEALGGNTELENNGWTAASFTEGTVVSDRFTNYNGRMIRGGRSFKGASGTILKTGLPSTANCVLGFALKESSSWNGLICKIYDNNEEFLAVYVNSLGYIQLFIDPFQYTTPYSGLLSTSTNTLVQSRWYYFELVVTATTANLLVDGESWVSTTDTFASISGFSIHMPNYTSVDDVYFTNDTTPLDAPRIITLYPNEGGSSTAWKETWREVEASGGYDTSIDEKYISSYTPGELESWKYNELPPGSWDVYAVGPVIRSKKNDAGTPTISVNLSTGASTSGIAVSDTFTHSKHVENYQTGTTAWTKSAVDGLELTVEYD